jgi:serine/threonine protein kinase
MIGGVTGEESIPNRRFLFERVTKKRRPQDVMLRVLQGVAHGMDWLHARGVIHGDLKVGRDLDRDLDLVKHGRV